MQVHRIGVDTVYEPFVQIGGADLLVELTPRSPFLSEAASSVEACAEYCAIQMGCAYFSYDNRITESEPRCYLFRDKGTWSEHVCCTELDYADENQTLPGWTSGRPSRTRHEVDNAQTIIGPLDLTAEDANGFTVEYQVRLGSQPQRGAVWIEPKIVSSTTLDVVIYPPRVSLYDNRTVGTITVSIQDPDKIAGTGETLLITNRIDSCDSAFAIMDDSQANVLIEVVPSSDFPLVPLLVPAGLVVLGSILAIYAYTSWKRSQSDSIWTVEPKDLHFSDPPEILGRGTFGLVLMAEYRGTQVAVKRVLPPSSPASRNENTSKDTADLEWGTASMGASRYASVNTYQTSTFSPRKKYHNKLKADFRDEMRQLSRLRHPCVTTIMGAIMGKDPMLVLEYMEHGSLYDLLHNETMVIEGELLLSILRDISQGMRFLHSAEPQVVHSDLKSHNILVDGKFRAKVSDFGLSQKQTLGGVGTPFWMAPELLRKESTNTAATDVFSFGIILYEVYSRRDPYEDEDPKEVLRQVADKTVRKRPPVPANMPAKIKSLMDDCLEDDPDKRPTSEELDTRLKRVDAEETSSKASSVSLFDIFPKHIAEALRDGRTVEAEHKDEVTIMFSDIVGFTTISAELEPRNVAGLLDRLYTKFDQLSQKHDVFKVETIGDAYMAVTNLISNQEDDHAKRIAEFAIDAIAAANETYIDEDDPERGCVNIRVGFHSGPVVADVVGTRNPRYCLFGDTVNTSSRMESSSEANRIHCSKAAAKILRKQCPSMPLKCRGKISIKGKGHMLTYWAGPSSNEGDEDGLTDSSLELISEEESGGSGDFLLPREIISAS